ncbi:hypothetical protein HPB50_021473 [Hyalomma asiaticum]|uniref:Uncharacterized protein n=1 Tax=Hyalomma asiaticum TaxID=266040 RepID=A0ACB7SGS9_HYAAI|nr:hypothetical protein HPB50_021473 [Hyalomma asiaticum]
MTAEGSQVSTGARTPVPAVTGFDGGCHRGLARIVRSGERRICSRCYLRTFKRLVVLIVPGDLTVVSDAENIVQKTVNHFGKIDILSIWREWPRHAAHWASLETRQVDFGAEEDVEKGKVLVVPGDVALFTDCENVVQKTVDHFGKLDILVSNAAIPAGGSLEKSSMEDFNDAWKVHVGGPLCLMKNAMPYLRRSKENAPYGVRINTINPGFVRTLIAKPPGVDPEDFLKAEFRSMAEFRNNHSDTRLESGSDTLAAMRRIAAPEEVAYCIAFLASDDASFVAGATMPVDGGLVLMSTLATAALSLQDAQKNK